MKLEIRRRRTPGHKSRRGMAIVVAGVAAVGGLVLGTGAGAERLSALEGPSLETLLRDREVRAREAEPLPPVERLRDRHDSLRERRRRIEEDLPRAVRPPRRRRPPLRVPSVDVPIRRPARAVDLDPTAPDGVLFEARP